MEARKTLVVGASTKPERYSNKAIHRLLEHQQEVIAYGHSAGEVEGVKIQTEWNPNWQVHTVSVYVSPKHQHELMDQIVKLQPKRVIFNPGTEDFDSFKKLEKAGIPYEAACTLVLLSTGQF